jgi:folate-dependent tRNA-U54 methylase TrmFO/GidA
MNVNFGLFPALEGKIRKTDRKAGYAGRALAAITPWAKATTG